MLEEFGYPHHYAVRALEAVQNESLDAAIEWLDAHREELDAQEARSVQQPAFSFAAPSPQQQQAASKPAEPSKTTTEMYNSDIRPDGLSRSKLEADRKKHAEFKRQKQIQEEKERLKKKEETARLVREKYAREKAERFAAKKAPSSAPAPAPTPAAAAPPKPAAGSSEQAVTVQVRVPSHAPVLIKGLVGGDRLSDLFAKVDAAIGRNDYVLTMPFPPPPTHYERDDARTLAEAGLCPRAALNVTDMASLGKVAQGQGSMPNNNNNNVDEDDGGVVPMDAEGAGVLDRALDSQAAGHVVGSECQICQSEIEADEAIRTIQCGHIFHADCLDEWKEEHAACPKC